MFKVPLNKPHKDGAPYTASFKAYKKCHVAPCNYNLIKSNQNDIINNANTLEIYEGIDNIFFFNNGYGHWLHVGTI